VVLQSQGVNTANIQKVCLPDAGIVV